MSAKTGMDEKTESLNHASETATCLPSGLGKGQSASRYDRARLSGNLFSQWEPDRPELLTRLRPRFREVCYVVG